MKKRPKDLKGFLSSDAIRKEALSLRKRTPKMHMADHLKAITRLARKYPEEIYLQTWQAAILGDWGQVTSAQGERKAKAEATRILRSLLQRPSARDQWARFYIRNELYYHSDQPRKQYLLGLEGLGLGYDLSFSAGVGASQYAVVMQLRGQKRRAKNYALEALKYWQRFPDPVSRGGVFYAQALLLAGKSDVAMEVWQKVQAQDRYAHRQHRYYYQSRSRLLARLLSR